MSVWIYDYIKGMRSCKKPVNKHIICSHWFVLCIQYMFFLCSFPEDQCNGKCIYTYLKFISSGHDKSFRKRLP